MNNEQNKSQLVEIRMIWTRNFTVACLWTKLCV